MLGNFLKIFGQIDLLIAGKPGGLVGGTAKQASPHNMAASRAERVNN
jgi:hypothetical protein